MTNPFDFDEPATATPVASPPAPVAAPTLPANPSPTAVDPAYLAWLEQQRQAAPVAPAAPPPVTPPAPPQDPAHLAWLAWLASQQQAAFGAGEVDPFSGPAPQLPRGPRLQEMVDRLILIIPKLTERVPSTDPKRAGEMVTRMTADVVILDGGPCAYGGKPEGRPPTQHDKVATIPHRNRDMFISAVALVSQCREALEKRARGEPGMVLGRLGYGEQKQTDRSAPWLLTPPTDADKAIARAYLASVDPFA